VKNLTKILVVLAAGAAVTQMASGEAAKSAPVQPGPSRSFFLMPANVREGRDPFYPESSHPYEAAAAASHSAVEISTLLFKGVSRTATGQYVAIINNHAFAVGDEGAVRTQGGSVHIRCLEIRPDIVVVEINGQKRELNLNAR
jgi:hypothetical protein